MKKTNLKKYIIRISLIFILLISAFSCIYAVRNYNSSNTVTQNNQFKSGGNESGNSKNTMDSNETVQSTSNGNGKSAQDKNMKPKNENKQSGQNGSMQKGSTNTKYVSALTAYSGIFLILCIGGYYLFKRKNMKLNLEDEKIVIFTLLAVGLLLRIAASTLMDGHNDVNLFKNWASMAANSLSQVYSSAKPADYPPLYIYVLALIGKIAKIPDFNSYYVLMLKLPAIISDIITAYFIYRLGKKQFTSIVSILLTTFYIFNPAIFIDSTFWGQVDSVFTLFIIFALFLLSEKKIAFSSVVFSLAILMKPQGIIFLPILFYELVRERKLKNFINAAMSAMITAIIIILPFSINEQNPLWIFKLYLSTISEYPYASVNAFNFFSLIGGNFKDNTAILFLFNYHTIGMIFIVVITMISWVIYIKGNNRKLVPAIAVLQIAGVFTFSAGMHERYLFPAIALAILAFINLKDRRFVILAIGFSITSYINISTILFSTNSSIFNILLRMMSLLNILLVGYLIKVLFDNTVSNRSNVIIDSSDILSE